MVFSLTSLGEFGLIRRLQKRLGTSSDKNIVVGIGDDCAVLRSASRRYQLLTQDLLLEGIHFLRGTPRDFVDLGYKALAVNLSDIAAMGGTATAALVGLGIPPQLGLKEIDALYRGIRQAARKFSCPIVGGDTNRAVRKGVISISVLGACDHFPVLRRGAKPGDSLWVTGTLGGARLGWKGSRQFRHFHSRPNPRLRWGQEFLRSGFVNSMIDVSDGLAGDLGHLAEASGVGFEVEVSQLPRHPAFEKTCLRLKLHPLETLISGGEDYELLFTVKSGREPVFEKFIAKNKISATCIGMATPGRSLRFLKAGKVLSKHFQSFRHF